MHLTATEAALFGALLGSLVTALATAFAQRAAKRSDHLTRIWEREMDIYESILVDSRGWAELRADGTRSSEEGPPGTEDLVSLPETDIDQFKRRRLYVQLEIFGRPEVMTAFDEAGAANTRWVSAYATLRSMLRLNHDVAAGLRPPPAAYTASEIEPLQLAVKLARKEADDRDAQLLVAIQESAHRVPKGLRRRAITASDTRL